MGLNLESTISLNSASFDAGIKRVNAGLMSVSHTIKNYVVGAIGAMTFESAFEKTLHSVKEYINESKRMGVSVEMVQVLSKAAKGAGLEIDAVAAAMERLNALRSKALGGGSGSEKAFKSFAGLGVSEEMLKTQKAEEIIFKAIRQKILSVNPQEIALPLREVLGKGGGALLPVIQKDIYALQKKMAENGQLVSTSIAYQLKGLDAQSKAFGNVMVVTLAPAMIKLGESVLYLLGHFKALSTWLGGLTSRLTVKNLTEGITAKDFLSPAAPFKLMKNFFGSAFDFQAAQNAMTDPDEFLKKWREETDEQIKHQDENDKKKINYGLMGEYGKEKPEKIPKPKTEQEDALVRAGNFAFALRSAVGSAEQKQIDLLAQIARNTTGLQDIKFTAGNNSDLDELDFP